MTPAQITRNQLPVYLQLVLRVNDEPSHPRVAEIEGFKSIEVKFPMLSFKSGRPIPHESGAEAEEKPCEPGFELRTSDVHAAHGELRSNVLLKQYHNYKITLLASSRQSPIAV